MFANTHKFDIIREVVTKLGGFGIMGRDERDNYTIELENNNGEVIIADEVVAVIAGLAAMEVEGVAAMAGDATKELISKTIEEIDKGNKITVEAVEGFERIIEELQGFATISQQNSEVSTTQAQALSQVEEGIEQISEVTQANAASSEECSAISEELAARATELDTLVKKFILHK